MIKCAFKKYAGYVVDQQDDTSGVVWEKIAEFWPDDLDSPEIGTPAEFKSCVAEIDGRPRYPTDSPENTLASSMYFMSNLRSFESDDIMKIAKALKNSRTIWDITIPTEYIQSVFSPNEDDDYETIEKYADNASNLPITTEDSFRESAELFLQNMNKWDVKDRILISYEMDKAASYYECEDYDFNWEKSAFAEESLMSREDFMRDLPKHSMHSEYITKMASLRGRLSRSEDVAELALIAQSVHDLDKKADMNLLWGVYFPDPYESIVYGIEKEAEQEIDYSGLRGVFTDDVVDAIMEDPETIIETLPIQQKALVDDYVRQRSK